ncbi:MAG: hypothetical protein AAGJ35_16210 [Myxococcota bacterium]
MTYPHALATKGSSHSAKERKKIGDVTALGQACSLEELDEVISFTHLYLLDHNYKENFTLTEISQCVRDNLSIAIEGDVLRDLLTQSKFFVPVGSDRFSVSV